MCKLGRRVTPSADDAFILASQPLRCKLACLSACCAYGQSREADVLVCRQPGVIHHTASAASSGRTAPASSQAPFINLEDTYNECMASISEAGAAFVQALCPDDVQAGASTEVLQSWADPDSQK